MRTASSASAGVDVLGNVKLFQPDEHALGFVDRRQAQNRRGAAQSIGLSRTALMSTTVCIFGGFAHGMAKRRTSRFLL
jgi:hypothetical protein